MANLFELQLNPTVWTDLTNQDKHEGIENLWTIDLGTTRNDKTVTRKIGFVITHGAMPPLYNLCFAQLKAKPDWVEDFKIRWMGRPPVMVFPASVMVSGADFVLPTLPAFDFEIPDLSQMAAKAQDQLVKLIKSLIPQAVFEALEGLEGVLNYLASMGGGVVGFFQHLLGQFGNLASQTVALATEVTTRGVEAAITWVNDRADAAAQGLYDTFKPLIDWGMERISEGGAALTAMVAGFTDLLNRFQAWAAAGIGALQAFVTGMVTALIELPRKMLQIKLDAILPELLGNLDLTGLDGIVGFIKDLARFGDPTWVLQQLGNLGSGLVQWLTDLKAQLEANVTIQQILDATEGALKLLADTARGLLEALNKAADTVLGWLDLALGYGARLATFAGEVVQAMLARAASLIPVPSFSFSPLIQLPPPGTPFPSIPVGPYTTGLLCPYVQWPDWMTPTGVATIPLQLPPGLQSAMPIVPAGAPSGVIAFQSMPGYRYFGEIEITTKATALTGPKALDLYLVAKSDPAGLVNAGNPATGAVARLTSVITFMEAEQYIGFNPAAENPQGPGQVKSIVKEYAAGTTLYDLGEPAAAKILSIQTVGRKTGKVKRGTAVTYEDQDAVTDLEVDTTQSIPGSALEVVGVSYTYKNEADEDVTVTYTIGSDVTVKELEPIADGNRRRRCWRIAWREPQHSLKVQPPADAFYDVIVRSPKLAEGTLTTDKKLELPAGSAEDGAMLVVTVECSPGAEVKQYENLVDQMPYRSVGDIFDDGIRTAPSQVQVLDDLDDIIERIQAGKVVRTVSTEDGYKMIGELFRAQSFLKYAQTFPRGPEDPRNEPELLTKSFMKEPLLVNAFTGETKAPYRNAALEGYVRALAQKANETLSLAGIGFRLNQDAKVFLANFPADGAGGYTVTSLHAMAINQDALNLTLDPEEDTQTKLSIHLDKVLLHELIHASMSHVTSQSLASNYISTQGGGEVPTVEALTDYATILLMRRMRPSLTLAEIRKGVYGYARMSDAFYEEPLAGAFWTALTATFETQAVAHAQLLAAGIPAKYLKRTMAPGEIEIPADHSGLGIVPQLAVPRPPIEVVASNNWEDRPPGSPINTIVMYDTGGNYASTKAEFTRPGGNSSHYVVTRAGKIVQFVPDEKRAFHAGASIFDGVYNVNDFSIGIELVKAPRDRGYTDAQYNAMCHLVAWLMVRHNIPPLAGSKDPLSRVTSHQAVAIDENAFLKRGKVRFGRKPDPRQFNWRRFRAQVLKMMSLDYPAQGDAPPATPGSADKIELEVEKAIARKAAEAKGVARKRTPARHQPSPQTVSHHSTMGEDEDDDTPVSSPVHPPKPKAPVPVKPPVPPKIVKAPPAPPAKPPEPGIQPGMPGISEDALDMDWNGETKRWVTHVEIRYTKDPGTSGWVILRDGTSGRKLGAYQVPHSAGGGTFTAVLGLELVPGKIYDLVAVGIDHRKREVHGPVGRYTAPAAPSVIDDSPLPNIKKAPPPPAEGLEVEERDVDELDPVRWDEVRFGLVDRDCRNNMMRIASGVIHRKQTWVLGPDGHVTQKHTIEGEAL